MRKLHLDMDGVFADFDLAVRNLFGIQRTTWEDDAMWDRIREVDHFYRDLSLMSGAREMWDAFKSYKPSFLTGLPRPVRGCATAGEDKVSWVRQNFGEGVPVVLTARRKKHLYCKPGDVILDDRDEFADRWRQAGGIFVHHNPDNVQASINEVRFWMDLHQQ